MSFAIRLKCSKLGAKIGFLILVRLRPVRGAWRMKMGFLSWICTLCAILGVVSNVLGGMNYDGLYNLRYFFSRVSAAF